MRYRVKANNNEYIVDVNRRNVENINISFNETEKLSGISDELRTKVEHLFDEVNTYKIRDYFSKTPSALLTIISMFIAGCAFVAGIVEFICKCEFCSYWGINSDYIRISGIMPFMLSIAVINAIILICLPRVFIKEFESLSLYFGGRYLYIKKIKYLKRRFKWNKEENKRIIKTVRKIVRSGVFRSIKICSKICLYTIIMFVLIYNVFIIMLGSQELYILYPLMLALSGLFGIWIGCINKYQKRIVNLAKEEGMDDNPPEELISIVEKKVLDQLDRVVNFKPSIREWLSDETCRRLISSFVVLTSTFVIFISLINYFSVRNQKQFDIAVIDDNNYAVMMFVDEQYLLKPIKISEDGKNATIESNELRIELNSFTMKRMKFQNVKKQ